MSADRRLLISWHSQGYGQMEPKKWHTWTAAQVSIAESQSVKEPFPWVGYLHVAKQLGLTRDCGWDLCQLLPGTHMNVRQAAQNYLRGCTLKPSVRQDFETFRGSYLYEVYVETAAVMPRVDNQALWIIDRHALKHWSGSLPLLHLILKGGEGVKSLAQVADLIQVWRKKGQPRHWNILGGGSLCDSAAYAAHLSGCTFTLLPTTLLAMVDACVGGKCGVNLPPWGKNIVGAFAYPQGVKAALGFLSSLSTVEVHSGLCEALKHTFIAGLREDAQTICSWFARPPVWEKPGLHLDLLARNCKVKAEVIAQDATEQSGLRHCLNYGHTLGHALESLAIARQQPMEHGICVAFGICFANHLGAALQITEPDFVTEVETLLFPILARYSRRLLVSTGLGASSADAAQLWRQILHDKKKRATGETITHWIFLRTWGCLQHTSEGYLTAVEASLFATQWQSFQQKIVQLTPC
ncbi:MAG: hypothetical protein OXT67_04535 [Zetaproteobacteria bacterium]|nr:hypothetical protein [Zetaproteobacteria bacterium]